MAARGKRLLKAWEITLLDGIQVVSKSAYIKNTNTEQYLGIENHPGKGPALKYLRVTFTKASKPENWYSRPALWLTPSSTMIYLNHSAMQINVSHLWAAPSEPA